jgi:hypothetical protein
VVLYKRRQVPETKQALETGMIDEEEINLAASAGTNDLSFEQVEPGRELVINHLSGYNDTSAPALIRVGYWNRHRHAWLKAVSYPLAAETVGIQNEVKLGEGMYPVIRFEGCAEGDDLYASLNGYWIKK